MISDAGIRYVKACDDVSIAYICVGNGPALVYMPPLPLAHLQLELRMPSARRTMEHAQPKMTWVRYDPRGFGLSERDVPSPTVDALVRDVEAVVDHLQLETFALMGLGWSSPAAIAYAARHPKRVSHLVLWHGFAHGADAWSESIEGVIALAGKDWVMATEALVRSWGEWSHDRLAAEFARLVREATTSDAFVTFLHAAREWDVRQELSRVVAPTLVAHRRHFPHVSLKAAQSLAAHMPNAQLLLLDGAGMLVDAATLQQLLAFVSDSTAPLEPLLSAQGTAVVLFTDIANSAALTERMGNVAFRDRARELDQSLRDIIAVHHGTAIEGKLLGDGVLAVFTSASNAIAAALRCAAAGEGLELPLHVGLHAGDVIRERDNVYGGAVNIAARVCGASAPGEILVSATVRELARTSVAAAFEDRGARELKGVSDAVHLYEVRWRDS